MFYEDDSGSSDLIDKGTKISDLVENKQLKLKHPVCLECFDSIIEKLDKTMVEMREDSALYEEQLR